MPPKPTITGSLVKVEVLTAEDQIVNLSDHDNPVTLVFQSMIVLRLDQLYGNGGGLSAANTKRCNTAREPLPL